MPPSNGVFARQTRCSGQVREKRQEIDDLETRGRRPREAIHPGGTSLCVSSSRLNETHTAVVMQGPIPALRELLYLLSDS